MERPAHDSALLLQNKPGWDGGGFNGSAERRTRRDRIDHITKIEHQLVLFAPLPPPLKWKGLMRNADILVRERPAFPWGVGGGAAIGEAAGGGVHGFALID